MTIDISGVSYWGNPLTVAVGIQAIVVVISIVLIALGYKRDNENLLYPGVVLATVSVILGSILVFGVTGIGDYETRVFDFKYEALLTEYDEVVLNGSTFVANKDGAFIEGFLTEKSEGVFVVLEGK